MAEEIGGISYTVDANTAGLLKLEKQVAASTDTMVKDFAKSDRAVERFGVSLAEADQKLGRFIGTSGRVHEANGKFVTGFLASGQSVKEFHSQVQAASGAAATGGRQMGGFGNAASQLGFQVQDVAVQLQAGASAFTVLAQQGSQAAAIMGPGGAVVGAVIAVAAAVGGVLFTSLKKTSAEIKDEFIPSLDKMKEKLDSLSQAQAQYGIIAIGKELKPLEDQARNAAAQVEYLEKQIAKYPSNKDIGKWNETLIEQRAILDGVNQKTKEKKDLMTALEDVISRVTKGTQGQQKAEKEQADAATRLIQQLQLATVKLNEGDAAAIRMSAAMTLNLKAGEQLPPLVEQAVAALIRAEEVQARVAESKKAELEAQRELNAELDRELNAELRILAEKDKAKQKVTTEFESVQKAVTGELETPAQRAERELAERLAVIQAYGEQEKLTQDQINAYKEQAAAASEKMITENTKREQDARKQLMQTTLGSIGDLFGNLADIAKEGGEDSFKTWKMMASAQAAINAALAITNVLATVPAPFNIPLAASVGALAAVNIAKIQSQQYSGRLYGGPVQAGGMYPINEDGRPEVLKQGNRQYLLPGSRGGQVVGNKELTAGGGAGGAISIHYAPTIYAQQSDFEAIMAGQPQAVLEAVRAGLASEGKTI